MLQSNKCFAPKRNKTKQTFICFFKVFFNLEFEIIEPFDEAGSGAALGLAFDCVLHENVTNIIKIPRNISSITKFIMSNIFMITQIQQKKTLKRNSIYAN